jgi:hypothetical protein
MTGAWIMKRTVVAVALAAVGLGIAATPAAAEPVLDGTLKFSGDAGDYITGGKTYSYAANKDQLTVNGGAGYIGVSVNGYNGDWWSLDLAAPLGKTLAPGTYDEAHRYPFQGAGPGLDLSGNGRGCNTLTGSFTIQKIGFADDGRVQRLDATFEQHCEGGATAARGELHINNVPPPPPLNLGLAVSTAGEASLLNGSAYVHGTVSCNVPVHAGVSGEVKQVVIRKPSNQGVLVRGKYTTAVDCKPGSPVAWSAEAEPNGRVPFQRGLVEAKTTASGVDPEYGKTVSVDDTTVVTLTPTGPAAKA